MLSVECKLGNVLDCDVVGRYRRRCIQNLDKAKMIFAGLYQTERLRNLDEVVIPCIKTKRKCPERQAFSVEQTCRVFLKSKTSCPYIFRKPCPGPHVLLL